MIIFYSRDPEQARKLSKYCALNNIELIAKSMISFEAVDFTLTPKHYDVLFFTSPRSVDFFLKQHVILDIYAIACIGLQTKNHLEKLGFVVDFYGKESTEPENVALEFKIWLGSKSVLLPISNKSNHSIVRALPKSQYDELIVYQTKIQPCRFDHVPDVIVFSSPSNAEAYLCLNKISKHQSVFSFGRTTYNYLQNLGIESAMLSEPSEEGVIQCLVNLCL